MNGNFDFVFQGFNRFWMVSITFILNGSPQKIVQRSQIRALRRTTDIRIAADYSIFESGAQKIDCYVGCAASGPSLLEPNVVHVILFNFWKPILVEHGTVTLAIDRNGGSQNRHQTVTRCGCIGFLMMTFRFFEPQMRQFCLLTSLTFCLNNRKCTEKLG